MWLRFLCVVGVSTAACLSLAARPVGTNAAVSVRPASLEVSTIPARPAGSRSGSDFARSTIGMSGAERQRLAVEEVLRGNIPDFLRKLVPVEIEGTSADGTPHHVVLWVMPDYLAIGPDADFLRIPLSYPSATQVANRFGFTLPTRKMVDAIYDQSAVHLDPAPMKPGPSMRSSNYYLRHQQIIEAQRAGHPLGQLTSGHKKDVVLSNRLHRFSRRVAIYGWHRQNREPIQPLSTVHGAPYADYSHGIRLVSTEVLVDGTPRSIYDLLIDPQLASLLTYEGEIREPRRLMDLPAKAGRPTD